MHKEPRKVREFRRREQEILDTALKLFLDQGEDSVTVEMIADAVGIGIDTAAWVIPVKLSPAILPLSASIASTAAAWPVVPTVALTCRAISPSCPALTPA